VEYFHGGLSLQELESQIKGFQLKIDQENASWENKLQIHQAEWDKYRKDKEQFETDIEQQYQKDIQLYREKIKRLQAKISEQQSPDRPASRPAIHHPSEPANPPQKPA
jgi:thymidylate synthase ThyX